MTPIPTCAMFSSVNILQHIALGLRYSQSGSRLLPIILMYGMEALIHAAIDYFEFHLLNDVLSSKDILSRAYTICIIWVVYQGFRHVLFLQQQSLILTLRTFLQTQYLSTFLSQGHLNWLHSIDMHNLHNSVEQGVEAQMETIKKIMIFSRDFLGISARLYVLYSTIGTAALYLIPFLVGIFASGVAILQWNYSRTKLIRVQALSRTSQNQQLIPSLLEARLNNRESETLHTLVENSIFTAAQRLPIQGKTQWGYTFLELVGFLCMYTILRHASTFLSAPTLVAFFQFIFMSLQSTWEMFHTLNQILIESSRWAPMQKMLKQFRLEPETLLLHSASRGDTEYTLAGIRAREYKILGESGSGKSTWMKQHIIHLLRSPTPPKWIYLSQNMSLHLSATTSIRDFFTHSLQYPCQDQDILHWSHKLNLDKIIHTESLDSPFQQPSPGETKRILLLHFTLPILMNHMVIDVLLCDEITAGLDSQNYTRVRSFLHYLKHHHNIVIVTIDHHTLSDVDLSNVQTLQLTTLSNQPSLPPPLHRPGRSDDDENSSPSLPFNMEVSL